MALNLAADRLLRQREVHSPLHWRHGSRRQPGPLYSPPPPPNLSRRRKRLKLSFRLMQIIVKEKGIFTNVTSPTSKAKLRLLFEVAPLGLLIEQAGGHSSDGKQSVLDKEITTLDERTQVAYGSKNEIIRFEETLYGSSRLKAETAVGATA